MGKTFALDATRAAWEASEVPVIRAALSARAAKELSAGSGNDSTTLARLLDAAPGSGETASQLKSVYTQIGRTVGYDVHRREITDLFTGIALAIAMLAAISALVWSQKIV